MCLDTASLEPPLRNGMLTGSTILTLMGEMPVEQLSVGDRVITRNGARVLRAVYRTILPKASIVCISASALTVDRPRGDANPHPDLRLTPNQGISIRDWRAKMLEGRPNAVIAVKKLTDGDYMRMETATDACIISIAFDGAEVIYAHGLELACPAIEQHA